MTELYKKYRPKEIEGLVGQPEAVAMLKDMRARKDWPHAILLSGPSGCGKTTAARILRRELGCESHDWFEVNAADYRGIEMVREIRSRMQLAPMGGKCRIWHLDEAHSISKDAGNAFLKALEDTPSHVWFILSTTEPQKLLRTIQTRCAEIKFQAIPYGALERLVKAVCKEEKAELPEEVRERLCEAAEGLARKALVLLGQVLRLKSEEEQLGCIMKSDVRQAAISVAKALFDYRQKWPDVAKVLKGLDEEAEGVRHLILAYARTVLLGGGKSAALASVVIREFRDQLYDCKQAGLALACWEVMQARK